MTNNNQNKDEELSMDSEELEDMDQVEEGENKDEENDHALLNILGEKDKLIVSLKEPSTQRDILNEKQIRMLSEDNSKKNNRIKSLQSEMKAAESAVKQKEAELKVFKITEEKLSSKIEDFKVAFEQYKSSIRENLDGIKSSITEEFAKREEYKDNLLENIQSNYEKLEEQIQSVDDYYKGLVTEITKKQNMAKKYIRQALNNIQEGLSYLDLSHMEVIDPLTQKEEFRKVMDESEGLFNEFKDLKGKYAGGTVIENIENVNIKLSEAPVIEGVFREIREIKQTAIEEPEEEGKKKTKKRKVKSEAPEEVVTTTSESQIIPQQVIETQTISKQIIEHQSIESQSGGTPSSGTPSGGKASSEEPAQAEDDAPSQPKQKRKKSAPESDEAPGQKSKGQGPGEGGGAAQNQVNDDRVEEEEQPDEEPKPKKKSADDYQEMVFKRGKNYAPFNWRSILSDVQLDRFQSIIESSIKAEKEGQLMKALGLYKTVQEQPGVSSTIAGKLLEDHIEYLEDIIKRQYSIEYRPEEADKFVETI
jgi:hypothetical protein